MNLLPLPERIETKRLVIQRLRYEDADEIFYVYASKPEATRFVLWPTHQRMEDTRQFLNYAVYAWSEGTEYSYAVRLRVDNRLIGAVGMMHASGKIQLGYIFSPVHWGQGYATEVCQAIINVAKSVPAIMSMESFVDAENKASIRVLQKSGFEEKGLLPKGLAFPNQGNAVKKCHVFQFPLGQIRR